MKGLLAALGFLTSIPLPRSWREDLAAAPPYFPMAGALLGMVLAAIYGLGDALVGRGFAAAAAVCALALLTRGVHLDGLADTFDALGGGRDREGMLEVMRDPHVGTFGVAAVGCVLILKFSLLLKLPQGVEGIGQAVEVYPPGEEGQGADRGRRRKFSAHQGLAQTVDRCEDHPQQGPGQGEVRRSCS